MSEKMISPGQNTALYLLAGLGNPGREYRDNRHNVGFMLVDQICKEFDIKIGKFQAKALIGSGSISGQKVILAKPQTYMNLSGQSISGLVRYYKVPLPNVLLAHDDLDLPLGTLRLRPSGGSAGQKGVASTIEQLGTAEFARLRIGIGRPPGQMDSASYVLQNFPVQEQDILKMTLERALKAVQLFIERGLEAAMNQYNGALKES
jgi:peptidyl-tRNA hydrolase, PTH1 family